jgi:CRP/FNR family transcriptional regulator, anaerobic regulatory protein
MIPIKTESAWRGTSDCKNCGIRDMVLFADLNEHDFGMIHAPIDDLAFKLGAALYSEGQAALGFFTIRTGMIKLVRTTADGRARIVRILRPGDVAGLEALVTSQYDSEAVALTDISVCRIPLEVVHRLAANSQRLHLKLMQKWQQTLKDADDWLADLNFGTAKQRVSNLILKMRSTTDGQTVFLFSRDDMGAMLDLKFETVSREISKLVKDDVIEPLDKLGRVYRILQISKLEVA